MSKAEINVSFLKSFLNDLLQTQRLHSLLNEKSSEGDLALIFQIEEEIQDVLDYLEDK